MQTQNKKDAIIFGLSKSIKLAENISKKSGITLGKVELEEFRDKEIYVRCKTSVRGKTVFVVQSTSTPANESLMELLIFLDALKRSSVSKINVIIPYFGYARQDRKVKSRQPITAKLIADLLTTAGADRIITFDLHSDQIQGFFNIPVDSLSARGTLCHYFKTNKIVNKNFVVVSPDHGGVTRAREVAKKFDVPLAIVDKRRLIKEEAIAMLLLGEVKNKHVIIVDDMVDTAGTISESIKLLKREGAKDIYVAATHPILSGTKENKNAALEKMLDAGIKKFITTNTISETPKSKAIVQLDLSNEIALVIDANLNNKSVGELLHKK